MRNLFLFLCLAYIGCKKSDVSSTTSTQNTDTPCIHGYSVGPTEIIEGQYIVAYNSGAVSPSTPDNQISSFGKSVLVRHQIKSSSLLRSFPGKRGGFIARLSKEELSRLQNDAAVSMIEPDRIIALGTTCFTVVAPWLITWNINTVGYGNGIGKVAWVIDSGIDFNNNELTVDTSRSRSFIDSLPSATDENGHGTHVAGIIGAKNNSFGVLGVASGATLVSLRVLDKDGIGTLSAIIEALAYVSTNAKAGDAVNLSLGEDGISDILDQQVKAIAAKGIFISIAAGNNSTQADKYSPARVNATNVYTVSAIDSTGKFANFSNYGKDVVDYAAPGVRILSTYLNNKYAIMSGTSMAAPHVTGLLLLKGNNITSSGTLVNDPDGNPVAIAHY